LTTQGPNYASTAIDQNDEGHPWTSLNNVLGPPDGQFTYVTIAVVSPYSDTFYVEGYGFSIPSAATINGVAATVTKAASGVVVDDEIKLVVNGSPAGTNEASIVSWPSTLTGVNYGGPADLWGNALTPAIVNASNFGLALACLCSYSSAIAEVDSIGLTIYYTVPYTTDQWNVNWVETFEAVIAVLGRKMRRPPCRLRMPPLHVRRF
jgi:hypothetical protein